MTGDKQARRDAAEIVESLLAEIYASPKLTPKERSIVGQLETVKSILRDEIEGEDNTSKKPDWVLTDRGQVLVQIPDDNQWGFSLHDGATSWPGGLEVAASWSVIENDHSAITPECHEEMDWLFFEDYTDGEGPKKAWYDR